MANPFVHAVVLLIAIAVPGGLLVYFAWHAAKAKARKKAKVQKPSPEEALEAFKAMYPPDSLRAKSRMAQLSRAKTFRRKNPKN